MPARPQVAGSRTPIGTPSLGNLQDQNSEATVRLDPVDDSHRTDPVRAVVAEGTRQWFADLGILSEPIQGPIDSDPEASVGPS